MREYVKFLTILTITSALLIVGCSPKEREHLNPYDPEYPKTNTGPGGGGGGSSQPPARWYVYNDSANYPWSGWMGANNGTSFSLNLTNSEKPYDGAYCVKIHSDGSESWAGIYVQFKGNWRASATPPFANLTNYDTLVFYAKASNTSRIINEIGMGESSDSSGQVKINNVNLTTNWQRFEIDLSGKDLSSINGLFYFSEDIGPYTIYFDLIFYTNK